MESPLSHFRFAQFQFTLKALDCINLPTYKGSTFRGAFGHAFKKIVCVHPVRKSREASNFAKTILKSDPAVGQRGIISNGVNREKICGTCMLKEKCVYSYVFETPPPSDTSRMRKYPYSTDHYSKDQTEIEEYACIKEAYPIEKGVRVAPLHQLIERPIAKKG